MKINPILGFLVLIPLIASSQSQRRYPQLGKSPLSEIIEAMTPEEKAMLLTGTGMAGFGGPVVGETYKLVPGAAGTTAEIRRLGIPGIVVADGPAGLRISPVRPGDSTTYYCTAFPIATLLASSWDVHLVNKVGKAMGNEVLEYGVDVLLAPALNIQRNPLGGRNFEYYAEDPLLAGKITAAMVNGIQSNGVGTSIKHFAANNQESNRMKVNVVVGERALREIYLKGFHIAVEESNPWTVMSSYNKINGTYTSESKDLLTYILRNEWAYKGLVMTDWFGGTNPVMQVIAGNDLLMPGIEEQRKVIVQGLKSGSLDSVMVDRNVEHVLQLILKTPRFKGYKYSNKPDLKKHALIARRAASEGMVLLKNEQQALPLILGDDKTIHQAAVFGITSYHLIAGGTGSGDVNKAYSISLVEGLENSGITVDRELETRYTQYIKIEGAKVPKPANIFMPVISLAEMEVDQQLIHQQADENEVAIITIGRSSGEFADRKLASDFNLSVTEKDLIDKVSEVFGAKGKKTIVILNIGGVVETASWKDKPDAILLAWQPGQEGGNAIADVLTGKVNPSGKLSCTFPVKYEDEPSAKGFPGVPANQPEKVLYNEGIFVGYRYFSTFKVIPSYPFGYGLSYTSFSYGEVKLGADHFEGHLTASLTVKNTGETAGKEVVQLYLTAPSKENSKPVAELKGFVKTKLLAPGESQVITFNLLPEALASFDSKRSVWVAEEGEYQVHIGSSVADYKQTVAFKLDKEMIVERVSRSLVLKNQLIEMKR